MTIGNKITLEQLLEAREQRAAKQKGLIKKFALPLISFTVNIPGARKNTPVSRKIFYNGCNMVMKILEEKGDLPVRSELYEPDTGYEAYFVINTDQYVLKALMLQIENEYPLGRLLDLDVIGTDGIPISRGALGYSKRKCLLCDQDAHICTRSRKHLTEDIINKIQHMVDSYI